MDRRFLLPLILSLASFSQAQDPAQPAAPAAAGAPVPASATPASSDSVSDDVLTIISAASRVPPVCVQEILDDTLRESTLGFRADPYCATYLALSSKQYQALAKHNRDALAANLLKDPTVQSDAMKIYKTISQQQGSSTGTGGSTNLTSKGLASQFLNLASEFGALTESTSGQTNTFSGTLGGIPIVLLKDGFIQNCPTNLYGLLGKDSLCTSPRLIDYLSRISYSVGVNSSTGNQAQSATVNSTSTAPAVPAVFSNSGSTLKVTAVSGKWIILQGKPSSTDVTAAYKTMMQSGVQSNAHTLALAIGLAEPDTAEMKAFRKKANEEIAAILKPNSKPYSKEVTAKAVAKWKSYDTEFVRLMGISDDITPNDAANNPLLVKIQQFAVAYAKTIGQEQSVSLSIARPAILTFEYDNNRPLNQPSNSVFRVIYQAKLGQVTLTANGAASIYDSTPSSSIPGSERLRDVQFAAEADRTFSPTIPIVGKTSMTGSGSFYFQDQTSPSILNVTPGMPVSGVSFTGLPSTATQVFAQKGNIAIGQAKLTLGSGSNLKVPISVTYSNRTELVTSPVWRGQIGISYDFDSLFTKR